MIASANSPGLSSAALIDPRALMSIRNLELRARVVVEGFWKGLHRSPYHGFSVEFTEYRQYTPGDDPRYLDWRVYARSDRYFIKKFEDETNLRCHLLVDQSRSMSYGSNGYTKAQYAATLAYFLHLQGDAVGLLTFDEKVREYLPARHRTGHLRQLMFALEKPSSGQATNLATPVERITGLVRKRGVVAYVSDFLAPIERLEPSLLALTACGHEVTVFQVLDPAELTLSFEQAAVFEDIESQQTVYIDPAAARAEYLPRIEAHCAAVRATCQKLGIGYHRLSTEQPLELALFEFVQGRMRRGRLSRPSAPSRS
jgi:uncharacterized protein (DUF58 family)